MIEFSYIIKILKKLKYKQYYITYRPKQHVITMLYWSVRDTIIMNRKCLIDLKLKKIYVQYEELFLNRCL